MDCGGDSYASVTIIQGEEIKAGDCNPVLFPRKHVNRERNGTEDQLDYCVYDINKRLNNSESTERSGIGGERSGGGEQLQFN